ncbi:Sec-independent protein translocase protein TATC [Arabidopsis thaliana]|uniref:Sec-independent protein translocase protein TATC, chloroplastic n=4 Tax=Arabidopsis TaxID=3701 RepID=TATC_ARATH|nr:Sec-independent periplasmic protein translocase [Arabidopsis thaliana]Q9SJV5.2 RecName: Full=Sec-independent protein translocase protein TATC, chloroplastic; AltName: Full=Protein ALBINO AND PALE GREEN 2; AltName: Full=Protein TWIN-ARGININE TRANSLOCATION C; AltName: Full=Protein UNFERTILIZED EMBRYO SAC 3; Flags: Precursor [Arabidopsis thaliana]KAG7635486.1 Sec-independent periplasmic protein translocase TatC [Arabidopsis thaliana x Arabidopsis arenosa]KAG7640139.1 Sec-independent periplasmic |eukprot:NP_565252.1 Sec-independent periplasmic protein translocase [Arabidopsis thaliana]
MSSTSTSSALIHHFRLTTRNLGSPTKQRCPYAVTFCNSWREAGLRYSVTQRRSKGFGPVSALNDDDSPTETTPGVGSAVEDRPPDSSEDRSSSVYEFLYPRKEELPDDKEMTIFDHLEELRERIFVSVLAVGAAILGCFAFSKDLIVFLEAPVKTQGVRFLQLAPGEFFFTTLKVSGYCGLLLGSPVILYEIIAFVLPGLTRAERRFLGPIVFGSSLLFYAGLAFSYWVLTPAALNFFVNYAEGVVESLWSIDQYFEFVLVLMFSTGLSFQVPVIQLLLGQVGVVSGDQMLSIWRYVVVGAVVAAAVVTPSTDPVTQMLLATPLLGLYLGGAWMVKLTGR